MLRLGLKGVVTLRRKLDLFLSLIFGFVLIYSNDAIALQETGTIQGRVLESSGQEMPGAAITAVSPALVGGSATAYTDMAGYYRFPGLPPGNYQLEAELQGFQTVLQKDIRLFAANTLIINFTLQMEHLSESMEVSGAPTIDVTYSIKSRCSIGIVL